MPQEPRPAFVVPTTFPYNLIYWTAYYLFYAIGIAVLIFLMTAVFWPFSPDANGGCTDDNTCYVAPASHPEGDR